ncbi:MULTISPECIES: Gfo/Idh/MocA family protein [unclassified Oceanispirochaeta]|uniref:Gfo/Idh/MocA family protein n=1 Tax=unclassified Oceanispirochaeta TaxID=2635722 RepID=UPI000E097BC8|nr:MULTISPECIES: Gfo/Idh/MocA family oxidoreductase [unclassified Oceanispirochaeta]MBF9016792.1 Gfo/Idh/MocA family oxidoreductase [Oceanispirochaeta sp. M2]NPD72062.1 Gfo/Idh/MocA family oxidoreductase [Oceanispirochaeta sp. M1]RDG32505.1 gfo/Idh/MocA family oxidoreductase [Oceanispirochaeta sp. M1]
MNIGIVGCGNISDIYFKNLTNLFPETTIVGCCDLDASRAEERSSEYGVPIFTTEELLGNKDVDIILNLTTPEYHARINTMALNNGKHAYCEKPFALNREEGLAVLRLAEEKGLRTGCAPDTFLGAGIQTCRKLIDEGVIGKVHSAYAFMLCPGHESWHPGPEFYYQPGGGPMLDMGPYYLTALVNLLGPVSSVYGKTSKAFEKRICSAENTRGQVIDVNTWTDYKGILEFESGVSSIVCMSFDVFNSEVPRIEIHGTKGSLMVPDPNTFGGPVKLFRKGDEEAVDIPLYAFPYDENSRGIGIADMARALDAGDSHRACGQLAMHVLDTMLAFEDSHKAGVPVSLNTSCVRPDALGHALSPGEL